MERLAHERNLGRAPLWHSRASAPGLLPAPSVLYGREFRQIAGDALTVADQRLFAELTTRWVRAGAPESGRVGFSLGDAARVLGHRAPGGEDRRLVKESLQRLRRCSIRSRVRLGDGHETEWEWGLLSSFGTSTREGGRGAGVLSREVMALLGGDSVTYVDARLWDCIARDDSVAARLWIFLEAEQFRGGRPWRYNLFEPARVAGQAAQSIPPLAELLRLDHWVTQRNVVRRIRSASRVLQANDARYALDVRSAGSGNWRLEVEKRTAPVTHRTNGLPAEVVQAWRSVYGGHVPSARQAVVVHEVLSRHTVVAVVSILRSPGHRDPFRWLLDEDRRITRQRLRHCDRAQTRWAHAKRQEQLGAARLGDVLEQVIAAAARPAR